MKRADVVLQHSTGDRESSTYQLNILEAYSFYQVGHIQKIKYHPFITSRAQSFMSFSCCIAFNENYFLGESTARVAQACCSCPASLSGCCNHITGSLYSLEDYIHSGLQDDKWKGCTECLQTWNCPIKINAEQKLIGDVHLVR